MPAAPRGARFPVQTLVPGASVAVGLASGDLTAGAVGTVTYVDGAKVYAFGHPYTGTGRRSLLLQDAWVYAVVDNPLGSEDAASFKLAAPGHDVGALTYDGRDGCRRPAGRHAAHHRADDHGAQRPRPAPRASPARRSPTRPRSARRRLAESCLPRRWPSPRPPTTRSTAAPCCRAARMCVRLTIAQLPKHAGGPAGATGATGRPRAARSSPTSPTALSDLDPYQLRNSAP